MPLGFHVTAAMAPEEFAPCVFDSHYAYDPDERALHYVHTALRNGSLLYNTAGAGGLCRQHSAGMPIFDTNTNRICTRESKGAKSDTPYMPIEKPIKVNESNMGPELCASSYADVPWVADPNDPLSSSAGAIMGLPKYVKLDAYGMATYDPTADNAFPPPSLNPSPLQDAYADGWGASCAPEWGSSITCVDNATTVVCPYHTVCLRLRPDAADGVCISTAAYRVDRSRTPCFRTFHCADGLVCLADGGCSPLTLHAWNDAQANIDMMEIALLADDCGFQSTVHPFTQSTRGASAWEQVPDLLSTHGMCSHREWFAYRNAMQGAARMKAFNTSEDSWPWVFMRFDGTRVSDTSDRATMNGQLQTIPHPCDNSLMHEAQTADGQTRLQMCMGFQGRDRWPGVYFRYALDGAVSRQVDELITSYWMRTYDEQSELLHVGALLYNGPSNVSLGFLGASTTAENGPVSGSMAAGQARFFHCADRIACHMPEFTFTRKVVERVVGGGNLTEMSLRLCGPMGYRVSTFCQLDTALFPLLSTLLWDETCHAVWDPSIYASVQHVDQLSDADAPRIKASPGLLFCSPVTCAYAARTSLDLRQASPIDSVSAVASLLNQMWVDITTVVTNLATKKGAQSAYESINLCIGGIRRMSQQKQADMMTQYDATDTAGIYVVFRLSLYEVPLIWFHTCMLAVLLGVMDPSSMRTPDTSLLLTSPVVFDMWSSSKACSDKTLSGRKTLQALICKQMHPSYTFDTQRIDSPGIIARYSLSNPNWSNSCHFSAEKP